MLVDVVFVALVVGLLIAIYKLKFQNAGSQQARLIIIDAPQMNENRPVRGAAWAAAEPEDSEDSEEENKDNKDGGALDMRKRLRKEEKMREKQRKKEALEQHLSQQKSKREKEQEEQLQREQAQQQKRRKEEEYFKMLSDEQQKRKKAEYEKWKGMFTVETSGKAKDSEQEEARKKKEQSDKLYGVLTRSKVCLLEDLSHQFQLTTKELIQNIKALEEEKGMVGIFDERGKYMVIEQQQWVAIRNYIEARGRVKKTDIMQECARIIKIPDQDSMDTQFLGLIDKEGEA